MKDGKLLKNIDPMRKLMPYLLKTRNGSIVYSPEEVEFDNAKQYIRDFNRNNKDLKIGAFEVVIAAAIRTFVEYPYLNRFVAGKKLYARNFLSISFVVLKMVNGSYQESNAKVYFNKTDTIFDVSRKVNDAIKICRSNVDKDDDKLMDFVSKLPSPILNFTSYMFNKLSIMGMLPKKYIDIIPLFSSIYISNLGSVGHNALNHHLYEWGTTSLFITMGKITKKEGKSYLNLSCSIDERIGDGVYLVKALRHFSNLIKHPEKLEAPPSKIVEDDGI